ncbi:MAG: PilC/PilY family type IV pilus protein [Burkholderiales bacterium]
MTTNNSPVARRWIAAITAFTLAAMPMSQAAYGAATVLADQPIAAKVAAKPNLLYTFDDSGSMTLRYSPDFVVTNSYCRSSAGNTIAACNTGWFDNFTNGGSTRRGLDEPMHAAEFNKLAYNPNISYDPPVDGAGNQASAAAPGGAPAATVYKMMNAANTLNWARVPNDMYLTPPASLPPPTTTNTTDLSAKVRMLVWCNTDWPRTALPGSQDPATWAEVGDVNGEYTNTAGRDCRIDGTVYDPLDSAPGVGNDYNYPYASSFATPTKDAKFFYRNSRISGNYTNRTIWCKTSGPGWPQTCVNGTTCTGTITVTPSVPQTCFWQSDATTTGAPYTYSPVGCSTQPLIYQMTWDGSGCVGTIGIECQGCSRTGTTLTTGKNGRCRLASSSAPGSGGSNTTCNCSETAHTGAATCTLPACGDYDPPDTCSGSWNQICTPYTGTPTCNQTYGGAPGATGGTTLLSDANGAGDTCRHNNNAGAYTSNRFTYPETWPNGSATTTLFDKRLTDSTCGVIPRTVQIPQYYNVVSSVQYCNLQRTGASYNDDPWRGFGRAGVCKTKNDLTTYKYPLYGPIQRVGIVNDGRMFAYTDPFSGISGTRTWDAEMTNFANWWTYYRSRVLAAKTTTAIAFNIVDNTFRAGFHTMNTATTNWLDSNDFIAAQRAAWYAKLFGVSIGVAKTPTLDALIRIGQLVENGAGAVGGLPAHSDPIPTIAGNPVSCTANYHILFTDGTTDQITLPTLVGEVDGTTVPAPSATVLPNGPASNPERSVASLQALAGSPWPRPYRDAPTATANTLADISLYFWMRDLRTGAGYENDVPAVDGRAGGDLDWKSDPAFWQHVNFSALSYGADGMLDGSRYVPVTTSIAAGTQEWFTAPNYPAPPNNALFPAGNPRAVAVDDLWHATVNGRGKFVFAETPIEIAYGLGSIISGILNGRKARVGATFASRNLSATNNFIYEATIEPGWTGDLKKVTINTTTGAEGAVRWSAGTKLTNLLATPAPGASPVNDFDNTWFLNRNIVTRDIDAGTFTVVPFRWTNLNNGTNTQLNTLSPNVTRQQMLVAYLRGGSTFGAGPNPALIEGTGIGQFRERKGTTAKLGNISDSKPVVIGPPNKPFTDANDYGYDGPLGYKATNAARSLRVYVGANDGLFHVFNGEDDSGPNTGGSEVWAYVPSGVFTSAFDEGGKARKGIQALSFQDGGAPIFKHHFYVNAPPKTQDVDFANCGSNSACTPDWRSLVVASLGKGGNTYFAIDATNPAVADEAQAAAKVLWEFALPYSEFSFGKPIIAKTRADGWVVIVASGYNNIKPGGDGKGHLYVLRASDGALLRTLHTTAADTGTTTDPSGLAQISGYVKDDANQVLEQIYGGDLNGRLWRWDVSSADPTTWQGKTVLIAQLKDSANAAQPITTAPEIEIDVNNGIDRFVFVGTGRLLDPTDLTTPSPEQIQTAYAIRDGELETPKPAADLPIVPRTSMASVDLTTVGGATTAAPNGWYADLPAGQRVVVDVVAEYNVFSFTGTVLQPDPCLTSLPAYIYARDYVSGESLVWTSGTQQASFFSNEGAVGLELVALEDPTKSFPTIAIVYTKETNASIDPVTIRPKAFGGGHRLSWRLLAD